MASTSLLQDEIKQSRPFPSAAQEAILGVIRTADQFKRRLADVLAPFGVSPQQYNVLRILRGAGERGTPTLEIGDRMVEQSPGITRLIDRLEEHGWATRLRCQTDRRVVHCHITEAGRALLDAVEQPLQDADLTIMQPLSPDEQRQLIDLLGRLRSGAVERDCDGEMT